MKVTPSRIIWIQVKETMQAIRWPKFSRGPPFHTNEWGQRFYLSQIKRRIFIALFLI